MGHGISRIRTDELVIFYWADAVLTTLTTLKLVNAGDIFSFTDRPDRSWG